MLSSSSLISVILEALADTTVDSNIYFSLSKKTLLELKPEEWRFLGAYATRYHRDRYVLKPKSLSSFLFDRKYEETCTAEFLIPVADLMRANLLRIEQTSKGARYVFAGVVLDPIKYKYLYGSTMGLEEEVYKAAGLSTLARRYVIGRTYDFRSDIVEFTHENIKYYLRVSSQPSLRGYFSKQFKRGELEVDLSVDASVDYPSPVAVEEISSVIASDALLLTAESLEKLEKTLKTLPGELVGSVRIYSYADERLTKGFHVYVNAKNKLEDPYRYAVSFDYTYNGYENPPKIHVNVNVKRSYYDPLISTALKIMGRYALTLKVPVDNAVYDVTIRLLRGKLLEFETGFTETRNTSAPVYDPALLPVLDLSWVPSVFDKAADGLMAHLSEEINDEIEKASASVKEVISYIEEIEKHSKYDYLASIALARLHSDEAGILLALKYCALNEISYHEAMQALNKPVDLVVDLVRNGRIDEINSKLRSDLDDLILVGRVLSFQGENSKASLAASSRRLAQNI